METHAPSLGDRIASLHGSMRAQEKCAWIPAPIHILIMAALARIFTRLEALLSLWQAGTLPPPQPRTPSNRDSAKIAAPRPASQARNRQRTGKFGYAPRNHPASTVIPSKAKDPRFFLRTPGFRPLPHRPATARTARPRPTHDPPCTRISEKRPP